MALSRPQIPMTEASESPHQICFVADVFRSRVAYYCVFQYFFRTTSGVSSVWLREHFSVCPPDADDVVVERHARAWLWHFVGSFLFPDASGSTVNGCFMQFLSQPWEAIGERSWGSAVLAWLYRQLCDACRRTKANANLGGCSYLLQVWAWERLAVGRPNRTPAPVRTITGTITLAILDTETNSHLLYWMQHWDKDGSRPTLLYLWNAIKSVRGNVVRRYLAYTNELDCVTQWQVQIKYSNE